MLKNLLKNVLGGGASPASFPGDGPRRLNVGCGTDIREGWRYCLATPQVLAIMVMSYSIGCFGLAYLQLAREVEKDWEAPPSGDYVRSALAGKPFWQCPKPRKFMRVHGKAGDWD